jgi:hypothetical protein
MTLFSIIIFKFCLAVKVIKLKRTIHLKIRKNKYLILYVNSFVISNIIMYFCVNYLIIKNSKTMGNETVAYKEVDIKETKRVSIDIPIIIYNELREIANQEDRSVKLQAQRMLGEAIENFEV